MAAWSAARCAGLSRPLGGSSTKRAPGMVSAQRRAMGSGWISSSAQPQTRVGGRIAAIWSRLMPGPSAAMAASRRAVRASGSRVKKPVSEARLSGAVAARRAWVPVRSNSAAVWPSAIIAATSAMLDMFAGAGQSNQAGRTRISARSLSGCRTASRAEIAAPMEMPPRTVLSGIAPATSCANRAMDSGPVASEVPCARHSRVLSRQPGRSGKLSKVWR